MDISGFIPNFTYNATHELPPDLNLDVWFNDKDIRTFLDTVLGLKRTRARDKMDDRQVLQARRVLEESIVRDKQTWVMRLHMWCIRMLGRRTMHEKAANIYTSCLQLAVKNAITAAGPLSQPSEDDIRTALRADDIRLWLMGQNLDLEDEFEVMFRTKKSFNAPREDNDTFENLRSDLETEILEDEEPEPAIPSPKTPSRKPALDLSTDEAVRSFELTAANRVLFLDTLKDHPEVQLRVCTRWKDDLEGYFSLCLTDVSENQLEPARRAAVAALTQMKNAPRRTTSRTEDWRDAVTRSGLGELMTKLTTAEFMFNWQLQAQKASRDVLEHVLHSNCFHQWRESLTIIYQSWTPELTACEIASAAAEARQDTERHLEDLSKYDHSRSETAKKYLRRREQPKITKYEKRKRKTQRRRKKKGLDESTPEDEFVLNTKLSIGERFWSFLGDHPNMIPNRFNMPAYFFLLDEAHFLRNFTQWIRPGLELHGYTVQPKQVVDIYSTLCKMNMAHLAFDGEDTKLYTLYKEAQDLRTLFTPTRNVRLSKLENMPGVTVHQVTAMPKEKLDEIRGSAFTFHDSDRVKSKSTGDKESRPGAKFVDPRIEGIELECIRPIQANILKYGKDVHIFVDRDTKTIVGGVVFNAFSPDHLRILLDHHALISQYPDLRRGASFLEFAYGKMIPVSFRVPQGGRPGEDYAPSKVLIMDAERSQNSHGGEGDNDDIRLMYGHAVDAELMYKAVMKYVPEVVADIRKTSQEHGLKDMGSCGASSYYCTNYMSPQHEDNDVGWSLCCQLFKNLEGAGGSATSDYNFAFTKWRRYVETHENCVWWFRSHDLHGTIMPTHSTVQTLAQQAKQERRAAVAATRQRRGGAPQRLRGGVGSDDEGPEADGSRASVEATAGSPPRTGSGGIHVTVRKKDADRAKRFKDTEERSAARNKYWRNRANTL